MRNFFSFFAAWLLLVFYFEVQAAFSDQLEKIITEEKIRTPEQLLAYLPVSYLAQHTFIYRSESLHRASPAFPRAVVFGSDASFILTFNGNSTQAHFYSFDILEFSPKDLSYVPIEIRFSQNGSQLAQLDRKPTSCVICHGSAAGIQPNRSVYNWGIYPGVYGSVLDLFSPDESKNRDAFESTNRYEGRYRYLPKFEAPANWPNSKPNTMLGRLLNHNYLKSLAARLKDKKELFRFRYAILASLECAPKRSETISQWDSNFENYLSAPARPIFTRSLAEFLNSAKADQRVRLQRRLQKRDLVAGEPAPAEMTTQIIGQDDGAQGSFLFFIEQLFGAGKEREEISESVKDMNDQLGGVRNLARELYKIWLDPVRDSKLWQIHDNFERSLFSPYAEFRISEAHGVEVCSLLKESSLKSTD